MVGAKSANYASIKCVREGTSGRPELGSETVNGRVLVFLDCGEFDVMLDVASQLK